MADTKIIDPECVIRQDGRVTSGAELQAAACGLAERLGAAGVRRAAVCTSRCETILAAMEACHASGTELLLRRGTPPEAEEWIRCQVDALVEDDFGLRRLGECSGTRPEGFAILLATSGTTGTPRLARHSFDALTDRVRAPSRTRGAVRWLLTYHPATFAGLQVLLAAACFGSELIAVTNATASGLAQAALRHGPTNISGTPTFWRALLMALGPAAFELPLRQITLGGEIADQGILDRLQRVFPAVAIRHIYASTEAGAVFAVKDCRAGFPASWLTNGVEGIQLRVRNGELEIRSHRAMKGYVATDQRSPISPEGWLQTGDAITVADDRVWFMGRADSLIGVGGAKVRPEEVEAVVLEVPGVLDARVRGIRNPFFGSDCGGGDSGGRVSGSGCAAAADHRACVGIAGALQSTADFSFCGVNGYVRFGKEGETAVTDGRKVALVTGGSRGLGLAIVKALLPEYDIATCSRTLSDELREMGGLTASGRLLWQACEIGDAAQENSFFEAAVAWADGRGIFALVNNAGIAADGVLASFPTVDVERVLDVNLLGPLRMARLALRGMLVSNSGGRIVNISSIIGIRGYSGLSAYSASKAGLDGMTRALAREVGRRSITVNSVAPGYLRTEMSHGLGERQLDQIARRTPLRRLGEPADVVPVVRFLLSDDSRFITGQTIVVDGGITC
jgi:3-oxoacyl-[acyl-carrier protein] reductase